MYTSSAISSFNNLRYRCIPRESQSQYKQEDGSNYKNHCIFIEAFDCLHQSSSAISRKYNFQLK